MALGAGNKAESELADEKRKTDRVERAVRAAVRQKEERETQIKELKAQREQEPSVYTSVPCLLSPDVCLLAEFLCSPCLSQ